MTQKIKAFIQRVAQLELGNGIDHIILEARALESKSGTHPASIEVLRYLNQVAGKRFSERRINLIHISARLHEGIEVERLKQVIELKTFQWKNDPMMRAHLNPDTLFRPSKIEKYINEVEDVMKNPQQFKDYVQRNHQKQSRQSANDFDPLA